MVSCNCFNRKNNLFYLGPILKHLGWFHFPVHWEIFRRPLLSDADDVIESWTTEKSDVSSAKTLVFLAVNPSGKWLIYTKKNKGLNIEPPETLALIFD